MCISAWFDQLETSTWQASIKHQTCITQETNKFIQAAPINTHHAQTADLSKIWDLNAMVFRRKDNKKTELILTSNKQRASFLYIKNTNTRKVRLRWELSQRFCCQNTYINWRVDSVYLSLGRSTSRKKENTNSLRSHRIVLFSVLSERFETQHWQSGTEHQTEHHSQTNALYLRQATFTTKIIHLTCQK